MAKFIFRLGAGLLLASSVLIAGCANFEKQLVEQGYNRLDAAGIQSTLAGNTFVGKFALNPNTLIMYFASDGTLHGKSVSDSGDVFRDGGQWLVSENDLFCDQWKNWHRGTDCDHVYRRGDQVVLVNLDGTESSFGTIEQGNSRGL